MLFNSVEFIIFFIAILSVITILRYKKFQHIFLLISSYFFFYFTSNILLTLLIFSTILDFYVGKAIFETKSKKRKKILLVGSLSGNLGLLGFFKYADFGIVQINQLLQTDSIQRLARFFCQRVWDDVGPVLFQIWRVYEEANRQPNEVA